MEDLTREMAGRFYLSATEIVPDKPYGLNMHHSIRAVKSQPGYNAIRRSKDRVGRLQSKGRCILSSNPG